MTKGERLNFVIKQLGYNPNSFAEEIEVSRPTISDVIKGKIMDYSGEPRELTPDTIRKIITRFPQVNPDYLTGKSDEWNIPATISELDEQIDHLISVIAKQEETISKLSDDIASDIKKILKHLGYDK